MDKEPLLGQVESLIKRGKKSNRDIARILKAQGVETTEGSIRRFRKRHKLPNGGPAVETPGIRLEGDAAEITSPVATGLESPEQIVRDRGYDPKDWSVESVTVNDWEGPIGEGETTTYHQSKVTLKKRRVDHLILPARSDGWIAPPKSKITEGTRLVVVCGDQQAPFHDKHLHELFCEWLEENQPDEGVSLGDKVDFPDISRHRLDPENTATVNECIQSGYGIFRDIVHSSPNTHWTVLEGNHDERIRNILLDKPSMQPLYGVKQADSSAETGKPVLTLPFLLRFDELGIETVAPNGSYELAQVTLNKNLAVRHGWIARKGSGASALSTLEHLGFSVIVGHTHRQSLVYKTVHDINGEPKTLTAAEAGCMCKVDQRPVGDRQWPNYTSAPDWQQGFSTVTIHPDGLFRIENATYVKSNGKGSLLWRDQCYS